MEINGVELAQARSHLLKQSSRGSVGPWCWEDERQERQVLKKKSKCTFLKMAPTNVPDNKQATLHWKGTEAEQLVLPTKQYVARKAGV